MIERKLVAVDLPSGTTCIGFITGNIDESKPLDVSKYTIKVTSETKDESGNFSQNKTLRLYNEAKSKNKIVQLNDLDRKIHYLSNSN